MIKKNIHADGTVQHEVDPVLPNQGGRMMASDPEQSFPVPKEAVRRRAYQLFEQRGRRDGNALGDWLAAEAEFNGYSH